MNKTNQCGCYVYFIGLILGGSMTDTKVVKKKVTKPKAKRKVHIRTTIKQCKEAIRKNHGFITRAAKALNITRDALAKRIQVNPELQEVVEDVRESRLDLAEDGLLQALIDNERWAIEYFLKFKGRDRGYVKVSEQKIGGIEGGSPIVVTEKERLHKLNSLLGK